MINLDKLDAVISAYKVYFLTHWEDEKYKWEAIKHFQEYWDINAPDFAEMLEKATEKTENLLTSFRFYPRNMLLHFARLAPESVRETFSILYDESKDLKERVEYFQKWADSWMNICKENGWNNHYQNTNAISVYLWLRYPDSYYIYKYSECFAVAKELESNFQPKRSSSAENLIGCFEFYHEICRYLQPNTELQQLLANMLEEDCYADPFLRTMTVDVVFFVNRFYGNQMSEQVDDWFPTEEEYHLGFTVEDWGFLLQDKNIFNQSSLELMKRMKNHGGMATFRQLSDKYGETYNFYKNGSFYLARRIAERTKCPLMKDDKDKVKWLSILYKGKGTDKKREGSFIWKLRSELSQALDLINLDEVALYTEEKQIELAKKQNFCETLKSVNECKKTKMATVELYEKADFLAEVYMKEEQFNRLVSLLRRKKNVILQGTPGVGKTFTAKRLAYAMMGEKDNSRIEMIQFHQNYTYEDFIMGYKPAGEGFQLVNGIFYEFCQKAIKAPNKDYFFLIDEINRGNLSKIFGELLMLIEKEYRGMQVKLAYDKSLFQVPENVYIIGMMNTSDRNLAMIDYALRRRFSFFEMKPAFETEGFKQYGLSLQNETFLLLIEQIKGLNEAIEKDDSLGTGFCIGHSYFCNQGPDTCSEDWMREVIDYDILPTLQEYWFDNKHSVQLWAKRLNGVFHD